MTQSREPVRWLDQQDDLPPPLPAALVAYQERAPAAAERDAIFAGLQAQLSAAGAARAAHGVRRLWLVTGLGGVAAVLAVVMQLRAPQAERTPSVPASSPVRGAHDEPPALAQSPASPSAEPGSAAHPVSGPRSEREPAPAGARLAPTARAARAGDPGAELALLTPARRVLPSDPGRSLELVAEHARRFPRGAFAEERDLLRIEALLRGGERAAAARHARRFRLSYPRSAHLDYLAEALAP